jgi:pimeloyl-ACP methyl ester carboxylesterase
VLLLGLLASWVCADGPQDNIPGKVRPVPPPGVALPEADRAELQKGALDLGKEIDDLRTSLKNQPALLVLLPDVQVFHNAVRYALKYNEFYDLKEVATARTLLKHGFDRAKQLRDGKPAWTSKTGLVVRGYLSKIDGSVQPYGLVVPASYQPGATNKFRLDFWCHGRGEKLTELSFLDQRLKNPGEFTPQGAFVLHLYGRYCNANKFAGEVDLFEAYDHVRQHYPIDDDRLVIRGFSMGGAACWQFAVHFPGMWAAAAPGAGFAETPEFLDFFQKEKVKPKWYEEKLWHLYNSTDYAVNLFNCPTIAYSGEIDSQKQAADVMEREMAKEGLKLTHIIGPKTGHKYHPASKAEINQLIDGFAAKGRNNIPHRIRFTTWTLRYNKCLWLEVDGLEQHWSRARLQATITGKAPDKIGQQAPVHIDTLNVSAFTIAMPAGACPAEVDAMGFRVLVDGQKIESPAPAKDRSWKVHFRKSDKGVWTTVATRESDTVVKKHGLQGPIDDAFWDRFVMVRPTTKGMHDKADQWVKAEMAHAIEHWRKQFRGEALLKDDTDITDADIAGSNLVLWGDPSSNKILARIADKLPIRWDNKEVVAGEKHFDAGHHLPVLIYPNPLNPKKYVVLNSGFTFREYDYLNNARQVPKLPDFAVIDINVPVTSQAPGGVVHAGFFDERWQWSADK